METIFTNPNEITKGEFDKLNELKEFEIFTPQQIALSALNIAALMKKGEINQLEQDELDLIKSGSTELKHLQKYTINEMVGKHVIKTDVYVQPKQVRWFDAIEKSETGEKIEKGVFLDTELNRELNRVGVVFEKGHKINPVQKTVESAIEQDPSTKIVDEFLSKFQ